jgi:hypothetical protein
MTKNPEKIITIFGSGYTTREEKLWEEVRQVGEVLAKNGYTVCSGGYGGTMEAVSNGAKSGGGNTIGITIETINLQPNDYIDENVVMPNWVERLMELIAIGDAYVIFKGGSGTLVEISALLEMMNKKLMKEKLIIFHGDFWKQVIGTLKLDTERLTGIIERNVRVVREPQEIINILNSLSF